VSATTAIEGGEAVRISTILMPVEYFQKLDKLVAKGHYPNRSEAIRMAVRDLILEELQKKEK